MSWQRSYDRSHLCLLGGMSFVAMLVETLQQQMAEVVLRQQQTEQICNKPREVSGSLNNKRLQRQRLLQAKALRHSA